MCIAAGKVLMDRNCPEFLRDTAESGYDESAALIERWHGRDRLLVRGHAALRADVDRAPARARGPPARRASRACSCRSHVAENRDEVRWVAELFPWSRSYLDVYDHFGLLRERRRLRALHPSRRRRTAQRMADDRRRDVVLRDVEPLPRQRALRPRRGARGTASRVGLGTDVGGGTSFSMLRTLDESYKVAQLARQRLSPLRAFYLATLGGARALDLDDRIGNFAPGKEADFVVLDPAATPLLARRMARAAGARRGRCSR